MKKGKLLAILTEEGAMECRIVPTTASGEEIEKALSENYSLGSIQWMEISKISTKTLETLDKLFGKKNRLSAMKDY